MLATNFIFSFFKKKISTYYVFLFSIFSSLITYSLLHHADSSKEKPINIFHNVSCNYNLRRLVGYEYIKPLLGIENECQSESFILIKQNVNTIIESYQKKGSLKSASVYLKDFSSNDWMGINEFEKYTPGSLLKIPILITYLKMNELNPGILQNKIYYEKSFVNDLYPYYVSKSIKPGNSYSVKELLEFMITYSDNNAAFLLNASTNSKMLFKVFTDLGLTTPDTNSPVYPISVKEYSLFMRALYNASYLSDEDSEFAAELLSKCDFKDGITRGLPENTRIAHKFGEAGNENTKELHESALIYLPNKTYLITIMTRGQDFESLSDVIKEISESIFMQMKSEVSIAKI